MKPQDVYLTGKQIFMRSVIPSDFGETMLRWTNDREVTRFLSRGTFPGHAGRFQDEYESLKNSTTDIQLAVCLKEKSEYVGIAGLHSINWIARHAEFRILIGEKEYWGKGIGTESVQLLTAYAFEILNLNRIWLGVNAANQKAHQSYLKGGFQEEGCLRQEVYRNGRYFDVIRMSLLRSEYDKKKDTWSINSEIKNQLHA
jgi:ribosomal-protein-alanine N-acetyltransferase